MKKNSELKILLNSEYKILDAVKTIGSYNPVEIVPYFEESSTLDEHKVITKFLQYIVDNNKAFGHNYKDVVSVYIQSLNNEAFLTK